MTYPDKRDVRVSLLQLILCIRCVLDAHACQSLSLKPKCCRGPCWQSPKRPSRPARPAKPNSKLPNQRHPSELPSPGCLPELELPPSRTKHFYPYYSSPITPCTLSQPTRGTEPSSSLICDIDSHPHSSAPF